jgi:uncharacterized protein (DUF433 family)
MVNKTYVQLDGGGTFRVGGSRATLDVIVRQYMLDGTAEAVANAFPGIGLENIYGALAFYLANRDEVDQYLQRRQAEAASIRAEIEAQPVPPVVARLRELKAARQSQP